MRQRLWLISVFMLIGLVIVTSDQGVAGTQKDSYDMRLNQGANTVTTSVVCLDGHKFAVVVVPSAQGGGGGTVSIVQVWEDVSGRVVPAKCE